MNVSKAEGFWFCEQEGVEKQVKSIMYLWCLNKNFSSHEQLCIWYLVSLLSQIRSSFVVCFINICFQTIYGILDQNHLRVIFIYSEFMKNPVRSHIQNWSPEWRINSQLLISRGGKHVSLEFPIVCVYKVVGFVIAFFFVSISFCLFLKVRD